ncbi:MAG: class I SAM-dependent methyltransferase [Desulfobulbaceae bacterium]|nr:class I SAM-dependent methyltransferase [Desulfobulbaceae bacterium]
MLIGGEQRFHPAYSSIERAYIGLFGVPVVGLRIRARILDGFLPDNLVPGHILDAGSGPGVLSFLLARRFPAADVLGIDSEPSAVEASQRIARESQVKNVMFEIGDLLNLPANGHFDLVTCVDILEHVADDKAAVESLYGAIRPGGTLFLHVPALYRRYPVFGKRLNFEVPTHVRPGYEIDKIVSMVKDAGFAVIKSGYTFGFFETLANNLGYMITKAEKRHKGIYAVAFPLLNLLSWIGRGASPQNLGAGIYVIGIKPVN